MTPTKKRTPGNYSAGYGSQVVIAGALTRRGQPLLVNLSPSSHVCEQYRRLAVSILDCVGQQSEKGYVVGVTSPDTQVGKTLTSLNLALTLAGRGDSRVLLIEGDLWRPRILRYIEVHRSVGGLSQALDQGQLRSKDIAKIHGSNLDVLVSGAETRQSNLVSGSRLRDILDKLRTQYDLLVLDCPPLALANGQLLASSADGVLVVAGASKTTKRYIERALEDLGPDRVIGMVLNQTRATGRADQTY